MDRVHPKNEIGGLTFNNIGQLAMRSGEPFAVMLQGVVVFVPAWDDGGVCAVYVICLTNP